MSYFALSLVATFILSPQPKPATDAKVVGIWHYDSKSVSLQLTAEAKKQVMKSGGKATIDQMTAALTKMIGTLTVTFKPTHVIEISAAAKGNAKPRVVKGKWTLQGNRIMIVMDDKTQKVPEMTISRDAQRIHTVYSQPSIGKGLADLVKK